MTEPNETTEAAALRCLALMSSAITEAALLSKSVATCASDGNSETAFRIAMDIEPLLHEADHLLQAASVLRRRAES